MSVAILRPVNESAVRRARWLAPALLALGSLGCAAAWILLALSTGRMCAWMAGVAGIDAFVLLRLARVPAGAARPAAAALATPTTHGVASWENSVNRLP